MVRNCGFRLDKDLKKNTGKTPEASLAADMLFYTKGHSLNNKSGRKPLFDKNGSKFKLLDEVYQNPETNWSGPSISKRRKVSPAGTIKNKLSLVNTLTDFRKDLPVANIYRETTTKARRGQRLWAATIRELNPQCIITGINKPNMLEAAHILPHAKFPDTNIALNEHNGFMITRSLHKPFDNGDWTITNDAKVKFSPKLSQSEITDFNKLGLINDMSIKMEQDLFDRVSPNFSWHRKNIFKE